MTIDIANQLRAAVHDVRPSPFYLRMLVLHCRRPPVIFQSEEIA